MFRMSDWAALMQAWHEGRRVEIDEKVFDHFLEVLPPVCMGRALKVRSGATVHASFGFAEGAERITAFWETGDASVGKRYWLEHTDMINRN